MFLSVINHNPNLDLQALAYKLTSLDSSLESYSFGFSSRPSAPQAHPSSGLASASTPATPIGKRAALIVGNTYRHGDYKELPGCEPSAKNVKIALEKRGFHCQVEQDITADELKTKVTEFTGNTRDFEARLLYFSGHGGLFVYQIFIFVKTCVLLIRK